MAKIIPTRGSQNVQVAEFVHLVERHDGGRGGCHQGHGRHHDRRRVQGLQPAAQRGSHRWGNPGGSAPAWAPRPTPSKSARPRTAPPRTSRRPSRARPRSSRQSARARRSPSRALTSFPGLISAVPNDIFLRLIRSVAVATAGKVVHPRDVHHARQGERSRPRLSEVTSATRGRKAPCRIYPTKGVPHEIHDAGRQDRGHEASATPSISKRACRRTSPRKHGASAGRRRVPKTRKPCR
jgi:hypothetical protein